MAAATSGATYQLLKQSSMGLLQASYVHETVVSLMQQTGEKIDRTRGLADRLLCQLIHLQPEIVHIRDINVVHLCKKVISKLSLFLELMHVHIVKTTTTKLYEALALHGEVCTILEENTEGRVNLLSETDWDLPLSEMRPIRNELCKKMLVY
uniref:TFCD_C domain-containing protein n=1 Tax=Glossina austeni TaxID=7395 RepID=A0A1A9V249_GLOAU